MLLYHYSNEPYTELKTKQAQGKITPEEMEQEDKYALFRHDVSPSYAEISFLPDPIPLDIMGALYAGHDHHIWIPGHEIYEHIVDSKQLPPFKYHITETPDDVKQMFSDWPDNPTPEQKRAYFQAKNARKWKTGENGEGNKELEKNFSKYVNGTRNAYLTAVPLFDDYNWKQYAPMVPHVQINPEGGIVKLLRPARKVKIGKANVAVSLESYKGLHIPFSAKWSEIMIMKLFDSVAIEQVTYTNKELELLLPSIATEGIIGDIIDLIKSVFTSFVDIFKRLTLTYSVENDEALNEVIKKAKENLAYIEKYPDQKKIPSVIYDVGKTIMAVPPGFKGDLVRYIDVLTVSSEQIHKLCVAEASAYNSILSNYITNKNSRNNSKEYRAEISIIAKDNEKHTSAIHKFFNYSSKDSGGRMLKELVDSYTDLQKMEYKVEKLAKINNFKNIIDAQNTIAATVDLIDIFMEEAAKDPNANPAQIKSIALYTSQIAKLYESLTMVRFYSETAIKIYANIVETVRNKMYSY